MTFQPGRRIHRLVFDEDTIFPGLELRVHGITVDEWTRGLSLRESVDLLMARLVEWNWVDDNGDPVPLTPEGFASLDMGDMYQLARQWMAAVTVRRSGDPLDLPASPDQADRTPDPEFEASMPMDAASSNNSD